MIALGLSLFGFIGRSEISLVRLDQKIYPGIAIRVEASGYDVSKVEADITTPIEKAIAKVGGVRSMRSISEDGSVLIQIQMEEAEKLKEKSLEFREKIDVVATVFPREVHKPQVFRYDPTNSPLMVISFSKENMNQDELRELVEKSFKRAWEGVDGVSQVIVAGGKIREIQVACDAKQLEAYGLSLRDIVTAFQDRNQNDSLGKLTTIKDSHGLQMKERFVNMLEIGEMPIRVTKDGQIISIKDIAHVSLSPREENVGARLNAEEKVTAFIYKNESSDEVLVSEGVRAVADKKNLLGLKLEYNQDESKILTETLRSLYLLEGLALLSLLFFFFAKKSFFNLYLAFLVSLIPAYFAYLLLLELSGSHLSLASCYGLIFGNIFWVITRKRSFAFDSSRKLVIKKKFPLTHLLVNLIGATVLSFFLSPEVSQFYLSLVSSSIVCFLLLDIYFIVITTSLLKSGTWLFIDLTNAHLQRSHKRASDFFVTKGLAFRNKTEEPLLSHKDILPVSLIFFVILSFYTFTKIDLKNSIESDARETVAFLEFPSGTAFAHTNEISLRAEKAMILVPGVKQVVSKIDPGHSLFLIELNDGYVPDAEFLRALKAGIGSTDDGFLFFASNQDSSFFQEVTYDIIGYDQKELESLTQELAEKVKSLEGVTESILRYKPAREELQLRPNSTLFMVSDLTLPQFGDELSLALQGGVATKFIDGEKEVDVRVRFAEKYRNSRTEFNEIRIKNTKGRFLPISTVVTTGEAKVPVKIYHKNRAQTLSFAVKLEGDSSRIVRSLTDFVKSYPLPEGYRIEDGAETTNITTFPPFLGKLLCFLLPSFTFLVSLLSRRQMIRPSSFLVTYLIPYPFSIFLIQFFYPGAFYLPFQVSLFLVVPFGFYFVRIKYHITQSSLFYLGFLFLILLVFASPSVVSFLYIMAGVIIYLYLLSFGLRMQWEWQKKFGTTLWKYLKSRVVQAWQEMILAWISLRAMLGKKRNG